MLLEDKLHKLGGGAPSKCDLSDEEDITKCIEEKAMPHGRRHGVGLFCSTKPPKTNMEDNMLTHHQMLVKKNRLTKMYSDDNK